MEDGDKASRLESKEPREGRRKTDLTLTGILMEGLSSWICLTISPVVPNDGQGQISEPTIRCLGLLKSLAVGDKKVLL